MTETEMTSSLFVTSNNDNSESVALAKLENTA